VYDLRQRACKLRITGIKDELKHIDQELKSISPELKKVGLLLSLNFLYVELDVVKARNALTKLQERIATLSATVYEAEDEVFALFCRKIGVETIREYEEQQLKVAQEESQARLRFDTQIARLSNQYV
jgi:structural maintenance of chromosome 1